jgi:hypothetical protein
LSPSPDSWRRHIKKVHNVYDMLFYIIKVKDEPLEDCDFLEKYVKEQLIPPIKFDLFPIRMCLDLN